MRGCATHPQGAERAVKRPELLHGLPLDGAPLRRDGSLILRAGVARDLGREAEVLTDTGNCSHLRVPKANTNKHEIDGTVRYGTVRYETGPGNMNSAPQHEKQDTRAKKVSYAYRAAQP